MTVSAPIAASGSRTKHAVPRINILGCPVDVISFDEVCDRIRRAVLEGQRLQIATANVDFVMKARRDPVFARELWRSDLVTADGVPLLWAAALLGTPLRGRVNGTDLVWKCAEISAETQCPVALIGAAPGVAARAADKMRQRHPGARLHAIPTPFHLGAPENARLIQQIRALQARIILAALGAPKQERWLQAHMGFCGANVGIGCGSALDIISGDRPCAPGWMRNHGLEWLHRMLQEPGRLGKRYLIEDSPFVFHLTGALIRKHVWEKGGRVEQS